MFSLNEERTCHALPTSLLCLFGFFSNDSSFQNVLLLFGSVPHLHLQKMSKKPVASPSDTDRGARGESRHCQLPCCFDDFSMDRRFHAGDFFQLVLWAWPYPCGLCHWCWGLHGLGLVWLTNGQIFLRCDSSPGSRSAFSHFQWTLGIPSPHWSWVRRANYPINSPFRFKKGISMDTHYRSTTIHCC